MRLDHAIKRAKKLVDDGTLKGADAVAVHVLVEMCRRVHRLQKPIKSLSRALSPEEAPLNQQPLFREES